MAIATAATRRFRIALSVAAIAAAAIVAGCSATSTAADRERNAREATDNGSALSLNNVTLTVPAGWDSESFVNASGMAVFRVGSFSFPDAANDDVGQIARALMAPDDVLVNIVDVTATDPGDRNTAYQPLTAPLAVAAAHAQQQEGYSVPAAVIRGARINGHNLYVSVAFGKAPPSPAQVAAANTVLRTLSAS